MPLSLGPEFLRFLGEKELIVLGTARRDGTVHLVPVWYEFSEGHFWVNGGWNRLWLKSALRDPNRRITLFLKDSTQARRWAEIRARVLEATEEGARDHIEKLSRRHTGEAYRHRLGAPDRVKVKIEPLGVVGLNGGFGKWDVTTTG